MYIIYNFIYKLYLYIYVSYIYTYTSNFAKFKKIVIAHKNSDL